MGSVTPRAFKEDGHAFVLMAGPTQFLKFGSYGVAWAVDSPLRAHLYARRSEAERRLARMNEKDRGDDVRVAEIEVTWKVVG